MKLRVPRRKKHFRKTNSEPLPVLGENETTYTGRFNGFSVIIDKQNEMCDIHSRGFFGKGNQSRSYPTVINQKKPPYIRRRQQEIRKSWCDKYVKENIETETVILVNDTDSEDETEKYFENLNPGLAHSVPVVETLNLNLEEAYFLANSVKCLNIYDNDGRLLDDVTTWKLFMETQENFVQNYVVYHYFRARSWVVKSGLKFGGDFLLYKKGLPYFHASYLVVVDVINNKCERDLNIHTKSVEWTNLIGLNRLTETAAKEVLICQVMWPLEMSVKEKFYPDILKLFSVNTVLMRRWIPKQERTAKDRK